MYYTVVIFPKSNRKTKYTMSDHFQNPMEKIVHKPKAAVLLYHLTDDFVNTGDVLA